jgi:hypothetical protein
MAERTGVAAVVGEAMAEPAAEASREELGGQGWLLDEPPVQPRKRGRPPGSYNRTSAELREYLQALNADPTVALVRFYEQALADPQALAKHLGCDPIEVVRLGVQAAGHVQPFVRSKAPVEHHVKGDALTLVFSDGGPGDPEAGLIGRTKAAGPILDLSPESEQ